MKAIQFTYKGYAKGFKSVNISYVVLRGSTLNFSLRATDSGGNGLILIFKQDLIILEKNTQKRILSLKNLAT